MYAQIADLVNSKYTLSKLSVAAETTRAEAAENVLSQSILNETTRAEAAEAGLQGFNYLISQPLYFQVIADMPLKPPSNQVVVWMTYPDKKLKIQDENGNTGELMINWDSPSPQ
jgi:hypothetical protein